MIKQRDVWLVEGRSEDAEGKPTGAWYSCGWEVHYTKKEAKKYGDQLMPSGHPRRVVRYVRKRVMK